MKYYSKRLPDGRWGIYEGQDLLATIGCPETCKAIIGILQDRHAKQPRGRRKIQRPQSPLFLHELQRSS